MVAPDGQLGSVTHRTLLAEELAAQLRQLNKGRAHRSARDVFTADVGSAAGESVLEARERTRILSAAPTISLSSTAFQGFGRFEHMSVPDFSKKDLTKAHTLQPGVYATVKSVAGQMDSL